MARRSTKVCPIKVICEACIQKVNSDCVLCKGHRFYLWDPTSLLCYAGDGTPITVTNMEGTTVPVSRSVPTPKSEKPLDSNVMLGFIELWVLESAVRKWKLSLDETGWNACVWFNRYKKSCFETSDKTLADCIAKTYREIVKKSKKSIS